jgi:dTDP-4-amino-4,6-dideoxygalactose transaminase
MTVPFNIPLFTEDSFSNLRKMVQLSKFSGDGFFNDQVQGQLKEITKSSHVLLTPSCTHSLELALRVLRLEQGDEVIIPDWTFTSAVIAVLSQGANPVFVDCNLNPPNISATQIVEAITDRTRAVIVMNYNGIGFQLQTIKSICSERDIVLIEDNAHGLGAKYKGESLGSFGTMSTYSFHETKNFQCGEGGAITFRDEIFLNQAKNIREKGTDRSLFLDGKIEKYQWVDKGSSYLLAEPLSAILNSSLKVYDKVQSKRQVLWNSYQAAFRNNLPTHLVEIPNVESDNEHSSHIYYLILKSSDLRNDFLRFMKNNSIQAVFHYQSLSQSKGGAHYGRLAGDNTNSRLLSNGLVRLPLYYSLTRSEIEKIIELTLNFFKDKS